MGMRKILYYSLVRKETNLTAKNVKAFFIVILMMAIIGALSSCKSKPEAYYLQVSDWDEETVCINIVNQNDEIIVLLDQNVDEHFDSEAIIKAINDGQLGFSSPFVASVAYWRLVNE